MREIQLPQVNWNGTSRDSLFNQYLAAIRGLEGAMEILARTAPHGRDYQTLADPSEAFAIAVEQHRDRLVALHKVSEELHALAESVQP
jgi:hypothetical protein